MNVLVGNQSGEEGGVIVADTDPHLGNFKEIHALADTVIAATVGNITGTAGATLQAGDSLFGRFSSVTLTSGKVVLYTRS